LLDAAAAFAGVPLSALVMVREASGDINRKAWTGGDAKPGRRKAIIDNSLAHKFTDEDFRAIREALDKLDGKSNRAAWQFVRETITRAQLDRNLEGPKSRHAPSLDAIDDIGSDAMSRKESTVFTYARNPKIRQAVMRRAGGRCEFCNVEGFICNNGEQYLESHHIIALAVDGADLMSNVIAFCPGDHREAHFGKRRAELEKAMILKNVRRPVDSRNPLKSGRAVTAVLLSGLS
jgi:HNH endonuclease